MRIPQALATVAAATVVSASLATLGSVSVAGPASAAGDVCGGQTAHQNLSGATVTVTSNQPVRSGPAAGCNVRFFGPANVDVHCYRISNGNVWWFVDTDLDEYNTGQQGWAFAGNLSPAPQRNQNNGCQGPEF